MEKIIGLDIGEKRIGVAISDSLGMLAHPLLTLNWKGIDTFISDVQQILQENQVTKIVVGVPYTLKGEYSQKTNEILEIIDHLKSGLNAEIILVDERLTTKMARQSLQAVGKKPSKNRNKIDQIAAVYILQSYLDKNSIKHI